MTKKNIALIFYSRTNNTKEVAELIKKKMRNRHVKVDLIQIIARDKPSIIKAIGMVRKHQEPSISNTDYDLSAYNTLIIGVPSWAYHPAPIYRSYLKKVKDIDKKKVAIFLTVGVSIERNEITLKRFKQEIKESGIQKMIAEIIILTRRRKIIEANREIESFIDDIITRTEASS